MADVFLSYARGDRSAAERLANAVGGAGLSVWWDRHIKGGAEFSRDIERQLDAATHVLVLWSKEAVNSRWVRDEASVAADSGRLVGATIDGTPPPLGFRQFQTVDLQKWNAKGAGIPPELLEALEIDAPDPAVPPSSSRPPRRRLIAAGVLALLLAGAATLAIVRPEPIGRLFSSDKRGEKLSLAIMPFVTPGADVEYLGVGLSTALADSLAPLSGLKITASTSSQALAGKGLTAAEIAAKLGITHLVEGDVEKTGDRYTIAVRLIEAASSEQIWARNFEGKADELQAVKRRMARELAGALRARLGAGLGDVAERANVDPRAYEAYLRGLERVSLRDDRKARLEALNQFRLAASIQPDFVEAHAGYAYVLALTAPEHYGAPWNEIIAQQRSAVERALRLDPDNDLALIAKARALQVAQGEVVQSTAIAEQVLRRSPDFVPALYTVGAGLWMAGRGRAALGHFERAMDLDPFDPYLRSYHTRALYSLGEYETIRSAGQDCGEQCQPYLRQWWHLAILGFATPAQYRSDFPIIEKIDIASGRPEEARARTRALTEAFLLGRPYKAPKIENEIQTDFLDAAIAARLVGFEEGMRYARIAADRLHSDPVIDILNEGRVTFTPEQRADPRYHELFRHPRLVGIATARRKAGVTAGLPVFPVRAYAGR